jgi:histidine triad (HIT) family protein
MPSIFTRMIQGEIPCHVVAESSKFIAILDIYPRNQGHTLVIPKKEVDNVQDMTPEDFSQLTAFAHQVGSLLRNQLKTKRIGWAIAGFEVPHVHIHLIPSNQMEDMNLHRTAQRANDQELTSLAASLRQEYANQQGSTRNT